MEFRLIYQGKLPAESRKDTRAKEKSDLRKHFNAQLSALWREHPFLSKAFNPDSARQGMSLVEWLGNEHEKCGKKFVPLVHGTWSLACSLDILFLRRDHPGGVISSGGDIDNRLKVLFDGLRPRENSEMPDGQIDDPFFCLLADDSLITEVSVTTDRLILPIGEGERKNDVMLVIKVKTIQVDDGLFAPVRPWV